MKLIVGLGNPGAKYANTRHNAGFLALDALRAAWQLPDFSANQRFEAEMAEGTKDGVKIILAKPLTFMNKSGDAVQKIMGFYKIAPTDLIVIHDDLDILIGQFKIQRDVHSVGHNGVESIIQKLGTQDFTRVRLGVEMAEGRQARKIAGEDFVLQDFTPEEINLLGNMLPDISGLI